jgi:hypothetical protein
MKKVAAFVLCVGLIGCGIISLSHYDEISTGEGDSIAIRPGWYWGKDNYGVFVRGWATNKTDRIMFSVEIGAEMLFRSKDELVHLSCEYGPIDSSVLRPNESAQFEIRFPSTKELKIESFEIKLYKAYWSYTR